MTVSERGYVEFPGSTKLKVFIIALTTILAFHSKTYCQLYTMCASLILTCQKFLFSPILYLDVRLHRKEEITELKFLKAIRNLESYLSDSISKHH